MHKKDCAHLMSDVFELNVYIYCCGYKLALLLILRIFVCTVAATNFFGVFNDHCHLLVSDTPNEECTNQVMDVAKRCHIVPVRIQRVVFA